MPEKWRTGPGTLAERWGRMGWAVLWSDESRAYEVYRAGRFGIGEPTRCATVGDVERFVALNCGGGSRCL
jgi:hypothetical protein